MATLGLRWAGLQAQPCGCAAKVVRGTGKQGAPEAQASSGCAGENKGKGMHHSKRVSGPMRAPLDCVGRRTGVVLCFREKLCQAVTRRLAAEAT